MVFHGQHCALATLGLLGHILCAWVLVRMALISFWLVSRLVYPFALMLLWDLPCMYVFHLISLRLLYLHVFRIWCLFLLFSPWLPLCIYKTHKACMFCQFVYWLRSIVSPLLILDLSLPHYSTSSILWKLLNPRSASLHGTSNSATSLQSSGSTYTRIQLEIPGPWQKSWSLCPDTPQLRNHEIQPMCWVALSSIRNTEWTNQTLEQYIQSLLQLPAM